MRGFGLVPTFTALQSLAFPILRFTAVVTVGLYGVGLVQLTGAWAWPVVLLLLMAGFLVRHELKLMLRFAAGKGLATDGHTTPGLSGRFWGYSWSRWAAQIVAALLEWVDVKCVGAFMAPAAAGVYGVVNRCVRVGSVLADTARTAPGSMLAALAGGKSSVAGEIQAATARLVVTCCWPFFLVLTVFSPLVLGLFGEHFVVAAGPMSVISVVMLLAMPVGGAQSVILMVVGSRRALVRQLVAVAVAVLCALLLIPLWGLWGAVMAWGASALTGVVIDAVQVRARWRLLPPLRSLLAPGTVAVVCFGLLGAFLRYRLGISWLSFGATVGPGGLVYAAIIWWRPAWFGWRRGTIQSRQ
jgi:O-antigen/teichoic acid export membrane protein